MANVGKSIVSVEITDTKDNIVYTFEVTVTNQAPYFSSTLSTLIIVSCMIDQTEDLPLSVDPEGLPFSVVIYSGPSFLSVISNSKLRVFPQARADIGLHTIILRVQDEEPKYTEYTTVIKVRNTSP